MFKVTLFDLAYICCDIQNYNLSEKEDGRLMKRIVVVGVTGERYGFANQEFMDQKHFTAILNRFPEMSDDLCKGGRDNDRKY